MELADLTRGMQKIDFLEPEQLFCCKAGLVWVSWEQCRKKIEPEKLFFFAKPGFSDFHKVSVQKHFFRVWKLFFTKPSFSEFIRAVWKKQLSVLDLSLEGRKLESRWGTFWYLTGSVNMCFSCFPVVYPHIDSGCEKSNFFRAWIFFSAKPDFIP